MALETGTYISDLVAANPTGDDLKSQGDDHLRLLKSTIKASFPNVAGAVSATDAQLSFVAGVTSAIQVQIDTKFAKAGGVLTGALTLTPVAAAALVALNKPAGSYNNALTGQAVGLTRWLLELGTAATEAGSNAGSDFALSRYSDAGALIDVPLTVSRSTGAVAVSGALTVAGVASVPTPTLPAHAVTKGYADNLFNSFASAVRLPRQARTSNVALGVGDVAQFIDCSGTFTQTFSACATLASGWWAWIGNSGTGTITLTPNGAELIDGLASRALNPGERRLIQCDGSTLRTIIASSPVTRRPIFAASTAAMNAGSNLERIENLLSYPNINFGNYSLASNGVNVVAGNSGGIGSSPDGRVWTARGSIGQALLASDSSGFLGINNGGSLGTAYSADGITWAPATALPAGGAVYTQGGTIAGLSAGRYLVQSDGTTSATTMYLTTNSGSTWTTVTGLASQPTFLSSCAGLFVAALSSTTYYTSATGATGSWAARTMPGTTTGANIRRDFDGSLVAWGSNGTAWRSTDAINWTQLALTLPASGGLLTINGVALCGAPTALGFSTLHSGKWVYRQTPMALGGALALKHGAAFLLTNNASIFVAVIDPIATDAATGLFD